MNTTSVLDETIADSIPSRGLNPDRPINFSGAVIGVARVQSTHKDANATSTSIELVFDNKRTYRPTAVQREQLKDLIPGGRWRDLIGKRLVIQSKGRGIPVSMRVVDEWQSLSDVFLLLDLGDEPSDDESLAAMGQSLTTRPF